MKKMINEDELKIVAGGAKESFKCSFCECRFATKAAKDQHQKECRNNPINK